jgi:putative acetyltransferase
MRRVFIRRQHERDVDAVREVHLAAFAAVPGRDEPVTGEDVAGSPPEPAEARLVDDLRADPAAWLPALSLVAEDAGTPGGRRVTGHVVCTRATLSGPDGAVPVLGLGPLGVRPEHQGRGVGLALMHAVLAAADALGEPLVALLGDPAYYSRFGFVTATDLGVDPPVEAWGRYFQVRTLEAYDAAKHHGAFAYARPFDGL